MSDVEVSQYSADGLVVTFLGKNISPGLAEGDDAITVENREPMVDLTTGIKGDGVFSISRDFSGTIKLKYLQNSSSAKFLNEQVNLMKTGVPIAGPLIISEIGSDAKVTANKTMIRGKPKLVRGKKQNTVEFEFLSADCDINHGEGVTV